MEGLVAPGQALGKLKHPAYQNPWRLLPVPGVPEQGPGDINLEGVHPPTIPTLAHYELELGQDARTHSKARGRELLQAGCGMAGWQDAILH